MSTLELARLHSARRRRAEALSQPWRTLVPSIGTQRRIEALAWQGWTTRAIGASVERSPHFARTLARPKGKVTRANAELVKLAFERLSALPPPTGRDAAYARKAARRKGFAPAAAWDDMDDWREMPKGVASE